MSASALEHLELSTFLLPPEPGDELDILFLTTFGIDLAVLGAFMASTSTDELEPAVAGRAEAYGVADLLAFTPFAARQGSGDAELLVLADAGGIQNSLKSGSDGLARFLSRFVIPVRAERAGRFRSFFHPKLAVAGFKPAGNRSVLRWRVLIGSKNITRGAAFELGTWLESGAARQGRPGLSGQSVLAAIQRWRVTAVSGEKQRRYQSFLRRLSNAGLGRAHFPVGGKAGRLVSRIRLVPFDVPKEPREALVVTPFLNPGALPRMTGKSRGTVISNAFTSAECAALAERGWTARRWRGGTWEHSVVEAKRFPSTLHAKMALWRGERGWQLYVGSGNATAGGKVRNRELGLVLDLDPVLAKRLHHELSNEAEPFLADEAATAKEDDLELLRRGLAEVTSAVTMERRDRTLRLTLDPSLAALDEALPRRMRVTLTFAGTQEIVTWDPRSTRTIEVPLADEKPGLLTVTITDGAATVSALLPFEGSERTVEALRESTLPAALTRRLAETRWKERILAVRGVTRAPTRSRKKQGRKSRFSEPRRWVRHVTVEDLVQAATVAPERARTLLDPGTIRQVVFGGQAPPEGLIEAIQALAGRR